MTDVSDFAPALGRIPSGLFVVTCGHRQAEAGLLASWVQQCSFTPPRLSIAIKKGRDLAAWIHDKAPFAVHILGEGQRDLLAHFGKGLTLSDLPDASRRIHRSHGLPPTLPEALGVLYCREAACLDAGDHDLIVADLLAGVLHDEGRPAVHIRKNGLKY